MKSLIPAGAAIVALAASADETVANAWQKYYSRETGTAVTYTAQTARQTEFPTEVGTPIFWVDCASTNGWTFAETDGALKVLKVPSRVGNRYLTSDKTEANFDAFTWKGWGYPQNTNPNWVVSPTFTTPEKGLAGHGVIDFGAQKSKCGLVFDLWSPEEGCAATNILANIGTVLAVYDSTEGGGFFLGGDYVTGYKWHRGGPVYIFPTGTWDGKSYSEAATDVHFYSNPIFNQNTWSPAYSGCIRHDGLAMPPLLTGYKGDWETLAMIPSAAGMSAIGLGIGDARKNSGDTWSRRSGGMRIAEMIFFDKVLTAAEAEKIEIYLRTKWFGAPRGWNGRAELSGIATDGMTDNAKNGVDVTVDVDADETLAVQTVQGGHFGSSFVKVGAGALEFGAAPDYNTPITLRGGTLGFVRRQVPADVPTNYYFRLDASREGLVHTEDGGQVTRVDNFGGRTFYGRELYLATPCAKPTLVPDALGAGKPVIDFGKTVANGAYLQFATNTVVTPETELPRLKVPGISTVVAVIGAQEGGGQLVDASNFNRSDGPTFKSPFLTYAVSYYSWYYNTSEGVIYVDGLRRDPSVGYPTEGYHVVAIRSPIVDAWAAAGIGGKYGGKMGGLRIAELVAYDRPLSDDELRDASAGLMAKWLGRVPGDYAPVGETAVAEVQKVIVEGSSAIDVRDGETVTVGRLDVNAPLVKTGAGTLKVQQLNDPLGQFTVESGTVTQTAAPDVSSSAELAKAPSFHLDASRADSLETETVNGTNFVVRWNTLDWNNLARSYPGFRPWVDGELRLNGKTCVDFGNVGAGNPYMVFGRALHSIRSVFMVWYPKAGKNNFLLAWSKGADNSAQSNYDFHRHDSGAMFRNSLFSSVLTNGVSVVYNGTVIPDNKWVLAEAHSLANDTGGLTASAFACDRDNGNGNGGSLEKGRMGGQAIAEVVIYERELSEREKIATRNYLLQKWFPDSPQTPLPAKAADTDVTLVADDGEPTVRTVAADETFAASRVTGDGMLVKDGAGTLAVRDLSAFSGTLAVAAGTLKLTGEPPTDDGVVESGRSLHMDATCGLSAQTNAAGVVKVLEWRSKLDDGWTAEPPVTWGDSRPRVIPEAQNGLPVVDMAVPTSTNVLQCLRFKKDGVWMSVSNIHCVVSVFGSQNGGGYFLAGGLGSGAVNDWARDFSGGARVSTKDDNILGNALDRMRWGGDWYKNGVHYPYVADYGSKPKFSLSGDWDLLVWNMTKGDTYIGAASGFGYDTRTLVTPWDANNAVWRATGQQRLAEVIVYNRALSAAERIQNENYLRRKWGIMDTRSAVANAAKVSLAAEAAIDMDGKDQYLGELSGTGSVVNGETNVLTLAAIRVDCTAEGCPDVGAALGLDAGFKVVFENFPADGVTRTWTLAKAQSLAGKPRNRDIVIEGATGLEGFRPKLSVDASGNVTLSFVGDGFLLLVK